MTEPAKPGEYHQPILGAELRHLKLMEHVVAQAPDVVMAVDWTKGGAQLAITYVNDAFTRIFGYASEEAIGQNPTFLCGPSTDPDVLKTGLQNVLHDGRAVFDVIHYRKDGTPLWLEFCVIPIAEANGAITGTVSFARVLEQLDPRTYAAPFA